MEGRRHVQYGKVMWVVPVVHREDFDVMDWDLSRAIQRGAHKFNGRDVVIIRRIDDDETWRVEDD
jgi:hypothetical protein